MKGSAIPYLTFYGRAKEAAEFYTNVFGFGESSNAKIR